MSKLFTLIKISAILSLGSIYYPAFSKELVNRPVKEIKINEGPNIVHSAPDMTVLAVVWFDTHRTAVITVFSSTPDTGWRAVKLFDEQNHELTLRTYDAPCASSNVVLASDADGVVELIVARKMVDTTLDARQRIFRKAKAHFDVYKIAKPSYEYYFSWEKDAGFDSKGEYCGVNNDPDGAVAEVFR